MSVPYRSSSRRWEQGLHPPCERFFLHLNRSATAACYCWQGRFKLGYHGRSMLRIYLLTRGVFCTSIGQRSLHGCTLSFATMGAPCVTAIRSRGTFYTFFRSATAACYSWHGRLFFGAISDPCDHLSVHVGSVCAAVGLGASVQATKLLNKQKR